MKQVIRMMVMGFLFGMCVSCSAHRDFSAVADHSRSDGTDIEGRHNVPSQIQDLLFLGNHLFKNRFFIIR